MLAYLCVQVHMMVGGVRRAVGGVRGAVGGVRGAVDGLMFVPCVLSLAFICVPLFHFAIFGGNVKVARRTDSA